MAAEEAGERVDGVEQQGVDFGLLVGGLGAVADGEPVPWADACCSCSAAWCPASYPARYQRMGAALG